MTNAVACGAEDFGPRRDARMRSHRRRMSANPLRRTEHARSRSITRRCPPGSILGLDAIDSGMIHAAAAAAGIPSDEFVALLRDVAMRRRNAPRNRSRPDELHSLDDVARLFAASPTWRRLVLEDGIVRAKLAIRLHELPAVRVEFPRISDLADYLTCLADSSVRRHVRREHGKDR